MRRHEKKAKFQTLFPVLCCQRFCVQSVSCEPDVCQSQIRVRLFDGVALLGCEKEEIAPKACVRSQLSAGRCVQGVFFDDLAVCSCDTASFSTEWLC